MESEGELLGNEALEFGMISSVSNEHERHVDSVFI